MGWYLYLCCHHDNMSMATGTAPSHFSLFILVLLLGAHNNYGVNLKLFGTEAERLRMEPKISHFFFKKIKIIP